MVLTNVRSVTLILEGVPKETYTAAHHQLRVYLICKAETWRKIRVLWLEQSLPIFVARQKGNSILCQQIEEAVACQGWIVSRGRQLSVVLARSRNYERRSSIVVDPIRNEVGLAAVCLVNGSKVVPTQAEIESQRRSDLPVVLEVCREIGSFVVGFVDVGGAHIVRASGEIDSIRNCSGCRGQNKLCDTRGAAVIARNICEAAVVVELAVRPGGLEGIEHYVLVFNAHFEAVSAVNLGKVVDDLSRLGGFVGRQEVVGAQSLQPTKYEGGGA